MACCTAMRPAGLGVPLPAPTISPTSSTTKSAIFDAGYADLATAATDFAGADYPDGFAMTFWGLDDFLISPEDIALIGGLDALTGHPVLAAPAFEFGFNTKSSERMLAGKALTEMCEGTTTGSWPAVRP